MNSAISRRVFLIGSAAGALNFRSSFASSASAPAFELVAREEDRSLVADPAVRSPTWLYNGSLPGPLLRAVKGQVVTVRFKNELSQPTSIHWHGIRLENAMDGVPGLTQDPVQPGSSFEYRFQVPDAGTFWYHAHEQSWEQVARGLYGALIVDEEQVVLPPEQDISLVVDDWRLTSEGVLDTRSFGALSDWSHGGRMGNWLTVNGEPEKVFELQRGKWYRLRLINTCNARILALDPTRFRAQIIAYDGQTLAEPAEAPYAPLLLGPAQRMDLLFQAQDEFELEELSGPQPFPFVRFHVGGEANVATRRPEFVPADLPEPVLDDALQVRLEMAGGAMGKQVEMRYNGEVLEGEEVIEARQFWSFNGVANLAEAPLFTAQLGRSISLTIVNETAFPHAMHLHGHHFRVLSRSEASVDDGKPWRDTFLIGPSQTTHIAFVADNPGRWLLHCHMLEHAAAGMNTWFEVTA
ncbi:multicopper oxidase family protein [Nitratireductor basaltis]